MTPKCIDERFIATWEPEIGADPKYEPLGREVRREIREGGSVTKQTFVKILDWKWAGLKGKVEWRKVVRYLPFASDFPKIRLNPLKFDWKGKKFPSDAL